MKKGSRVFIVAFLIMCCFGLTGCMRKVPAGYVGVKVHLLGTSKGIDCEEVQVGLEIIGINQTLYLFPTFTQNYVWTKNKDEGSPNDESITFQTKEGMSVNADVGISYHLVPDKVSDIFQKYRKGIDEITDIYLRNMVRDAFVQIGSTKSVQDVYGSGKTELLVEVENMVKMQINDLGIIVEKIYLIGSMRLPDNVVTSLNAKIEATQKAEQRQNELAQAEAEAKKKVAEAEGQAQSLLKIAEAEAKANRIVSSSLTKELIQYKTIEKWNGELPKYGGTSGVIPFISEK